MRKTLKHLFLWLLLIPVNAAFAQQPDIADIVLYNGKVYSADQYFNVHEAVAVKDGKIVAVGNSMEVRARYSGYKEIDLKGKAVYPGFNDAHAHFMGYARNLLQADLIGTKTEKEALERVKAFAAQTNSRWVTGRGWDQNDWPGQQFPGLALLDSLFPDRPVYLTRIDGHAAWVNSKALELAGINASTKVTGGEILLTNGKPSGILVDEATELVKKVIPPIPSADLKKAIAEAQQHCFREGLTSLADAGLPYEDVMLIDSLQKQGVLSLRIYAMLTPDSLNLRNFVRKGIYKTDKLHVRSLKMYADGALGSRGACLLHPYSDRHDHYGLMLADEKSIHKLCQEAVQYGYQLNTHCIGDSAHRKVLLAYAAALKGKTDHRWRIEHAQVTFPSDLIFYQAYKVIPSVQPTHATSDMYWAGERLGAQRVKTAYTYKQLLLKSGVIALGTDFPVEAISPINTFYAAVVRKDLKGYPAEGFQAENALSREETLKGMTIWAAYAAFEEQEKGSIETGKLADLVVLDRDIMEVKAQDIPAAKVEMTICGGKIVYKRL